MNDSLERAKALQEAMKGDEVFVSDLKKAIEARDADAAIALAATKSIELMPEDFRFDGAPALEGKELDDAELEAVAGGYDFDDFIRDVGCYMSFWLRQRDNCLRGQPMVHTFLVV